MKIWSLLTKFPPKFDSIDLTIDEMDMSMMKDSAMTNKLMITVNSISSCSLYSMHCFQMWNYRLDYLPPPASPNVWMFVMSLSLILLRSAVSIVKKL